MYLHECLRVCLVYLSDIDPVAYDAVCGLGIFLCPLQVVRVGVSFQNPHWVGRVKVELGIVRLCYGMKMERVRAQER